MSKSWVYMQIRTTNHRKDMGGGGLEITLLISEKEIESQQDTEICLCQFYISVISLTSQKMFLVCTDTGENQGPYFHCFPVCSSTTKTW